MVGLQWFRFQNEVELGNFMKRRPFFLDDGYLFGDISSNSNESILLVLVCLKSHVQTKSRSARFKEFQHNKIIIGMAEKIGIKQIFSDHFLFLNRTTKDYQHFC